MKIRFEEMKAEFERVLLKKGFTPERASLCARLFAETSLDGIYTHGLNRFPRFIEYIDRGLIDIHAEPVVEESNGSFIRMNGMLGPGNLNAWAAMEKAVQLAKENGIACVALRNTNHWMRGGSYGWQAADAGCAAICFTNTTPNLPPWGSDKPLLGNNPLIIALPRKNGHIVVDTAMSQFSYGKMERSALRGEMLPVEGGFDKSGKLTRDPAAIVESQRALPMGYWKGSALSTVLDLFAAMLSGGDTTREIGRKEAEYGISQVFIAVNITGSGSAICQKIEETVMQFADERKDGSAVYYPGERTLMTRSENLENGIPADEKIWETVLAL